MRVYPNKFGALRLPEGAYGQDMRGRWFFRQPGQDAVSLQPRDVLEHFDGTITVSGYLDAGEWRAV